MSKFINKNQQKLSYFEVNAFVGEGLLGNPAGVCPLTTWLPDSVMQQIAAQNNLSETAFFVPEGDSFGLRWFTTKSEVDLCGHATMASAHVIWQQLEYASSKIKFNTRSGVLLVDRKDQLIGLNFPARPGKILEWNSNLDAVLHRADVVEVQMSRDILLVLKNEQMVRSFVPDFEAIAKLDGYGMIITAPGDKVDFVSRFFIPHDDLPEDPVTGSTHCHLIPYWSKVLDKQELVGQQLSTRGGELLCRYLGDRVEISGRANTYLCGEIYI